MTALFSSLKDIRKEYQEILDNHPEWKTSEKREISIHALHALCEQKTKLKVRVFSVETDVTFKKGMLLHGKQEIHVYMRQDLSREEKRFIQVKEFSHILADSLEYRYTSPDKLLEILSASSPAEKAKVFNEEKFNNSKQVLFSEERATFIALDLLYPKDQQQLEDREKLTRREITYRSLSSILAITPSLVTRPFSKSYNRDRPFFLNDNDKILDMTKEWATI